MVGRRGAGRGGPRGAVAVRKPKPVVVVCKTVWVNDVKVKRCT